MVGFLLFIVLAGIIIHFLAGGDFRPKTTVQVYMLDADGKKVLVETSNQDYAKPEINRDVPHDKSGPYIIFGMLGMILLYALYKCLEPTYGNLTDMLTRIF